MKMPKRTREIELDGDYEGFKAEVDLGMPMFVYSYINTGQWHLIQHALQRIIVKWNFVDTEGNPLPQPNEMVPVLDADGNPLTILAQDENGEQVQKPMKLPGITFIPVELGMIIVRKVTEQVMSVPNR